MLTDIRLPGVSDDLAAMIKQMADQLDSRAIRNRVRLSYYESKMRMFDVAEVIPPMYESYALTLGWSAKAVDALARRCRVDGLTWADGDLADLDSATWQEANRFAAEAGRSITDSLIFGVSFMVASSGAADEPRGMLLPRDALEMTGLWDPRSRRLSAALSIDVRDDLGDPTAVSVYLPGQTLAGRWDALRKKWDVDVAIHPGLGILVEPMSYRPHGRRPLGRSRISRPIMGLQDAAIRALTRLEAHMDSYSFPEYWMLGADETIFKNADGTQKAAWQIRMGRIKGIPDDDDATNPRADVRQFQGASPQPHLADLNTLAKMFAREASLPDSALAITDMANPTSAEAYDASQYELIAEAEGAIADWHPSLNAIARKALAVHNGLAAVPDSWKSIKVDFGDPRYQSKAAVADAGMKQVTALPWLADTSVGAELVGLTPQQIERAEGERRRTAGSDLLSAITAQTGAPSVEDTSRKALALGQLIRAGAEPKSAAAMLGLSGLEFTGAVPVGLTDPGD